MGKQQNGCEDYILDNEYYDDFIEDDEQGQLCIARSLQNLEEEEATYESSIQGQQIVLDNSVVGDPTLAYKLFWKFAHWFHLDWLQQISEGTENLPLDKGVFLIASNHQSHLDCSAVYIAAYLGGVRKMYALGARDYFFQNPLKRWFVTKFMNVLPISRTRFTRHDVNLLEQLKSVGSDEHPVAVLMFPEGTRSTDGTITDFKFGVGYLSSKLGVPVVPTYIGGTDSALPKFRTVPTQSQVRVRFGEAVDTDTFQSIKNNSSAQSNSISNSSDNNISSSNNGSLLNSNGSQANGNSTVQTATSNDHSQTHGPSTTGSSSKQDATNRSQSSSQPLQVDVNKSPVLNSQPAESSLNIKSAVNGSGKPPRRRRRIIRGSKRLFTEFASSVRQTVISLRSEVHAAETQERLRGTRGLTASGSAGQDGKKLTRRQRITRRIRTRIRNLRQSPISQIMCMALVGVTFVLNGFENVIIWTLNLPGKQRLDVQGNQSQSS